jgi:pyruvate kinase
VVAVSSQEPTCRNLQFSYGVFAVNEPEHPGNWKRYVRTWMEAHEMEGDMVLLTEGPSSTYPEANHRLEIINLEVKK